MDPQRSSHSLIPSSHLLIYAFSQTHTVYMNWYNSLTIMCKMDRLSWKPTISLLFNFMTNVMIHDHKTSPDLKWNSPTFPWPWRNFCPWPFPALWQPCLTFRLTWIFFSPTKRMSHIPFHTNSSYLLYHFLKCSQVTKYPCVRWTTYLYQICWGSLLLSDKINKINN